MGNSLKKKLNYTLSTSYDMLELSAGIHIDTVMAIKYMQKALP